MSKKIHTQIHTAHTGCLIAILGQQHLMVHLIFTAMSNRQTGKIPYFQSNSAITTHLGKGFTGRHPWPWPWYHQCQYGHNLRSTNYIISKSFTHELPTESRKSVIDLKWPPVFSYSKNHFTEYDAFVPSQEDFKLGESRQWTPRYKHDHMYKLPMWLLTPLNKEYCIAGHFRYNLTLIFVKFSNIMCSPNSTLYQFFSWFKF